jgi:hypothetical protein
MLQQFVVGILVVGAFAFSAWRLMPAQRRLRILLALDRWAAGHTRLAAWRERSLKPRIAKAAGVGCDGCAANPGNLPRSPR